VAAPPPAGTWGCEGAAGDGQSKCTGGCAALRVGAAGPAAGDAVQVYVVLGLCEGTCLLLGLRLLRLPCCCLAPDDLLLGKQVLQYGLLAEEEAVWRDDGVLRGQVGVCDWLH
jgi:hypothetical protein